ncbi:hypothetical protein C1I98_13795, partial [Spongiactinospora gelatinilytica]
GQEADPGPSPEDVAKAQQLQNKSLLDVVLEAGGQILMEILGVNDVLSCLKGDLGACVSMIVGALPWGKIFKAPKIIEAIWKAGKAVITYFQQIRWARAILRGAQKAAEAAKAAAAKAAREAAAKRAAAKAAADALAKKLAAEAAARAKAMAAKAKAKTKPKAPDPKSRGTKADSCPNSFATGTLVLLANGTAKPIEDVALGEQVLATDPETAETSAKPVVRLIEGEGKKNLVTLTLTIDTDGDRGTATSDLVATDGHPIWVQSEHKWLKADQLKPGMWLRTSAGTYVQITAIKTSTAKQRVHNFTIADTHTYHVLAGTTPVLVHNCDFAPGVADEKYDKHVLGLDDRGRPTRQPDMPEYDTEDGFERYVADARSLMCPVTCPAGARETIRSNGDIIRLDSQGRLGMRRGRVITTYFRPDNPLEYFTGELDR